MDQFITKRKRIQNELDSDSESELESEKSAIVKKLLQIGNQHLINK